MCYATVPAKTEDKNYVNLKTRKLLGGQTLTIGAYLEQEGIKLDN